MTKKLLLESLEVKLQKYTHSYYKENIKLVEDDYYDMYKAYFDTLNSEYYSKTNDIITHLKVSTSLADKNINSTIELLPIYDFNIACSLKVKGFYMNIVYENGTFVGCNTHLEYMYDKVLNCLNDIIPYQIDTLNEKLIIEGYLTISKYNFKKLKQDIQCIKNPLDAILYILQNSVFNNFLEFIIDRVSGIDSFDEIYNFCIGNNFNTPIVLFIKTNKDTFFDDIKEVMITLEKEASFYKYLTDGVFIKSNNIKKKSALNFLFKLDYWKIKPYEGLIKDIFWCQSKKGIIPIAEIHPLTIDTNLVRYINLYAPNYMLMLNAYKNNYMKFLYIDNDIIIPISDDGQLLFSSIH